jgi:response regulator of citrate/malate metabolism
MEKKPVQVLLLEDNPGDAEIVRDALDRAPGEEYLLTHVWRLREAVEKLRAQSFDVVIADLLVPDSMGLGTLSELRRACPRVPILVCTGTSDQETGAEAVRRGAQDYLVKGRVTSRFVRRSLRYAMERKAIENQLDDLAGTLQQQVAERTTDLERSLTTLQDEHRSHLVAEEALRKDERQCLERLRAGLDQLAAGPGAQNSRVIEEMRSELQQLLESNRLAREMLCGDRTSEEDVRRKSVKVNEDLQPSGG